MPLSDVTPDTSASRGTSQAGPASQFRLIPELLGRMGSGLEELDPTAHCSFDLLASGRAGPVRGGDEKAPSYGELNLTQVEWGFAIEVGSLAILLVGR